MLFLQFEKDYVAVIKKMTPIITALLIIISCSFAWGEEQTWKVKLKDADIRVLVTQVADITGKSFVIDPRVKGKVTVISNSSMTKNEVYEMFLSVLTVHGYTASELDGVIRITQQNNAKQYGSPVDQSGRVKGESLVTRVIQINHTSALELVPILRPMVAKYGHLAGVASANALIISDHANNINRITKIIERLDSAGSEELEVVQLQKAWVGDVVKLIENLSPKQGSKGGVGKAGRIRVVADERSNRLILKGEKTARERMKSLIITLDQPSIESGKTQVVRLQHADAKKLAEIIKGIGGGVAAKNGGKNGAGGPPGAGDIGIFPDEDLNALVIRAEPSVMSDIKEIIAQLDVRRAQVLIEAAIVEVSENLAQQLGVQIAVGDTDNPVGGTQFDNAGISLSQVIAAVANPASAALSNGVTVGGVKEDNGEPVFGVLVQALASNADANLLSTPSIMTLDNQEAQIIVGQNVPFVTGSTASANNANPFNTISREDIGITLKVKPHIHEGNVIRLEVEQSNETVSPSSQASDIITDKREIKTMVLVDNKETIILGGLIEEQVSESTQKVPLLGDIPLVGRLFKSTRESATKRNLLVFLRPTILREKGQAARIASERYSDLFEVNVGGDGQEGSVDALFEGDRRL